MKKHTLPCSFLGAGLLTVAAFSSRTAAQSVPTWLEAYRENPLPEWDGWRNALAPEGELSEPLALAEDRRTDYVIILPSDATPEETREISSTGLWDIPEYRARGRDLPKPSSRGPRAQGRRGVGVVGSAYVSRREQGIAWRCNPAPDLATGRSPAGSRRSVAGGVDAGKE